MLKILAFVGALVPGDTTIVPACAAEPYRAFDFWLGTWDVRDTSNTVVARNVITRSNRGCTMHEHYTTTGAFTGQSVNAYDATRERWFQTWSDVSGTLLLLEGHSPRPGVMVLEGDRRDQQGPLHDRITWTLLPDGRVRQLWDSTRDRGATWRIVFDGHYERVRAP